MALVAGRGDFSVVVALPTDLSRTFCLRGDAADFSKGTRAEVSGLVGDFAANVDEIPVAFGLVASVNGFAGALNNNQTT